MTGRENYLSLVRRQGYEKVPYGYQMCPSLAERFAQWQKEHDFPVDFPVEALPGIPYRPFDPEIYRWYYRDKPLKPGASIDITGVGHEPGSQAAYHMTYMRHPLQNLETPEQIQAYPFLDYENPDLTRVRAAADRIRRADKISAGYAQCTIWETSWYLRGMNELMLDMLSDEDMACAVLDRVTHNAVLQAEAFAKCGADLLFLGDDVGMQKTIMMSESMYCEWLKPRLKQVIDAARRYKPDILVYYHSCGYVTPLIDHLIDAGVDVLDPVQPECMDFREIHDRFGSRLSFHGTLGTQTTMPFGTPQQVRDTVFRNLDIAGPMGGLLPEPTHLLEPEVPVENVAAYIRACEDYTR